MILKRVTQVLAVRVRHNQVIIAWSTREKIPATPRYRWWFIFAGTLFAGASYSFSVTLSLFRQRFRSVEKTAVHLFFSPLLFSLNAHSSGFMIAFSPHSTPTNPVDPLPWVLAEQLIGSSAHFESLHSSRAAPSSGLARDALAASAPTFRARAERGRCPNDSWRRCFL